MASIVTIVLSAILIAGVMYSIWSDAGVGTKAHSWMAVSTDCVGYLTQGKICHHRIRFGFYR